MWGYQGPFPSHGSEGVGRFWALLGVFGWARTGRVAMAVKSGRPWRDRKRRRDAGCGGEVDPLFQPGWTHPLFLPGVAHPLFLMGWREEQQGEEGGEGGGGGHPLFVPG